MKIEQLLSKGLIYPVPCKTMASKEHMFLGGVSWWESQEYSQDNNP